MSPSLLKTKEQRAPDLDDVIKEILEYCQQSKNKEQILEFIQVEATSYAVKKYIAKFVERRFLNLTIPHNPRHVGQQYITSGKGRLYLQKLYT